MSSDDRLPFLTGGPGTLAHTAIMFRHGTRMLSGSAFKALKTSPVVSAGWDTRPFDDLTRVGVEQMKAMGTYFAAQFEGVVSADRPAVLMCSPVGRVRDSAATVVSAWPEGLVRRAEPAIATAEEAFRAWSAPAFVTESAAAMRAGLGTRAAEFAPVAQRMRAALSLPEPTDVHPESPEGISAQAELATSAYDVIIVESYGDEHAEAEAERFRPTLAPALGEELTSQVEELARVGWELRFFSEAAWGPRIGGALVANMILTAARGESSLALYAGHDYTLLALIAALGCHEYAPPVLDFGCSCAVTFWDTAAEGSDTRDWRDLRVQAYVLSRPFAPGDHPTVIRAGPWVPVLPDFTPVASILASAVAPELAEQLQAAVGV